MTKKEIITLAESLRGVKVPPAVLDAICRFCHAQNPRFDERRFRDYLKGECGPRRRDRKRKAPAPLAKVGDKVVCGFAGDITGTVAEINVVDGVRTATVLEDPRPPLNVADTGYWTLNHITVA